jgi:dTDP-4-dehydrorhamnose 3,5-epimerase
MKRIDTKLDGVCIIALQQHVDARGFFVERYHKDRLRDECGIDAEFVQDNHSRSAPKTLRGLHWQFSPKQGKLVGVTRGAIWDVAVDIRPRSVTFGQYFGVELSDANAQMLWIPAGFAHGFCVLGDAPADVLYKVSGAYNPATEGGIRYDDPDFAIDWPIRDPILSARDQALMRFADYRANPLVWE